MVVVPCARPVPRGARLASPRESWVKLWPLCSRLPRGVQIVAQPPGPASPRAHPSSAGGLRAPPTPGPPSTPSPLAGHRLREWGRRAPPRLPAAAALVGTPAHSHLFNPAFALARSLLLAILAQATVAEGDEALPPALPFHRGVAGSAIAPRLFRLWRQGFPGCGARQRQHWFLLIFPDLLSTHFAVLASHLHFAL